MGFFKKVFGGKKKKKGEEGYEEQAEAETRAAPEVRAAPPPAATESSPAQSANVVVDFDVDMDDAAPHAEADPAPSVEVTIDESPDQDPPAAASGEIGGGVAEPDGVPNEARSAASVSGSSGGLSPAAGLRRRSSGSLQAIANSVQCHTCSHELPVPLPGHPSRVTCPFCLTQIEYRP